MTRIAISSSAYALFVLLGAIAPVSLGAQGAQGARSRGTAAAQERAVPRGGSGQATQGGNLAPQPRAGIQRAAPPVASPAPQSAPQQRVEPSRRQPPSQGLPPSRRFESPNAVAVPRPLPRVIVPQTVGPIGPSQNVRPNNRPGYRPNYQPYYRPQYSPNYRPSYRPGYGVSYRPYYTFRPRVRLGFGLWIGYPVRYPSYYYPVTPYPYAYPPAYQSAYPTVIYPAPSATVGVAGGLSFEITPAEAGVYIDGDYLGTVSQFSPDQPPLPLTPGRHYVEIRLPGFEVITFDVDILPGQVIPYQGELRPF